MKALLIDLFMLAIITLGVGGAIFDANNYIKSIKYNNNRRTVYRLFSIPLFIIIVFITFNGISSDILGIKTKSLREHLGLYFDTQDIKNINQPADSPPVIALTSVEICGRALNFSRLDWATTTDAIPFVRQAKETGEQIDSCRIKLGLKTVDQERRDVEDQKMKSLANMALCQQALVGNSSSFSTESLKQAYVAEAHRREFSVADCERFVGRIQPDATPEQQTATVQMPKTQSTEIDRATGLPIAVVNNPSVAYSNMRSGPGTSFNVVGRLRNGIEVVILGSSFSASGHEWCEIFIGNGSKGFVSADFVSSSCQLSSEQIGFLREKGRQDMQDALQITKGLVDIFGNIRR